MAGRFARRPIDVILFRSTYRVQDRFGLDLLLHNVVEVALRDLGHLNLESAVLATKAVNMQLSFCDVRNVVVHK